MWNLLVASLILLTTRAWASPASLGWHFVQNGTSGILALETMIVSPTLAIMFDRVENNPLMADGFPAWGALWNLETNTASPLTVVTNSFCASGSFLSNGTMVSVGGNDVVNPDTEPDKNGLMGLRLFEPCLDPAGINCTIFEDPPNLHLVEQRWYPTAIRIFDGSLMIIGGSHNRTSFYNVDPANSFEFFPPKDGGALRPSAFLERSLPANLFPRSFALPDGRVFIVANNRSIIYDIEARTETILPDIPNGVRVTNPLDGTAMLLPLSPPDYTPEVIVCGGSATDDTIPPEQLSSQNPASDQCSRIILTPQGIKRGWVIERMLEPRIMPEMILLPNGQVLVINGGQTGYAAFDSVSDPVGNQSNADHPAFTPALYTPSAPLGQRFSNRGMPTTDIARMYHSTVTLTPQGNILVAGSSPNGDVVNGTRFHTEYRVETLNPPFMSVPRPKLLNMPKKILFNQRFTVNVNIPLSLRASNIQVALMDLGFSSHAFHSSSRLVFMEAELSGNRRTLTIRSPPNNRVFPPGPGFIFLTIDDVTSTGEMVMVGTGESPPVPDQGIRI